MLLWMQGCRDEFGFVCLWVQPQSYLVDPCAQFGTSPCASSGFWQLGQARVPGNGIALSWFSVEYSEFHAAIACMRCCGSLLEIRDHLDLFWRRIHDSFMCVPFWCHLWRLCSVDSRTNLCWLCVLLRSDSYGFLPFLPLGGRRSKGVGLGKSWFFLVGLPVFGCFCLCLIGWSSTFAVSKSVLVRCRLW